MRHILLYETYRYYKFIRDYYGNKTTERSKIPLINHIDEGIDILYELNSDEITIQAYCLHPFLQNDVDFKNNLLKIPTFVSPITAALTVEYRRVANSYLSKDKVESFVGFSCKEVKDMLVADKIQNNRDFIKYHEGTHPRSKELRKYFNNWEELLEINYDNFK